MEDDEKGDQPYNGHYWKKKTMYGSVLYSIHTVYVQTDIYVRMYSTVLGKTKAKVLFVVA